jgi:hypothetical protein
MGQLRDRMEQDLILKGFHPDRFWVRKLPKTFAPKKRGPIRTTLKPIALT